jgi:organic radical activating enzyme
MKRLSTTFNRFFKPVLPLPAGIYTYQSPPEAAEPLRLHLRLEPEGHGVLIVNARTVLHLNQTAAEYAYHFVKGTPEDEVAAQITRRYRIKRQQAAKDYADLRQRLELITHTQDLDPVMYLDFERSTPYSTDLSAPLRLDCALTYRLSELAAPGAAPLERVKRELTTTEWQFILDKAWAAGIPHVVFTGGEPTSRPDLPDLVAYAEQVGMVSGLLTDGLRLTERHYLHALLQSGLDHLMLLLSPDEAQSWEALRDVLAEDLFATVHLTLAPANQSEFNDNLDKLAKMGVKSVSLSTSNLALEDALQAARSHASHLGLSLVWDLPVPYSAQHPVALELEENDVPQGAGRAWLYVEPDGDVLPAQGVNQVMGNLLEEPWEAIWQKRPAA